MTLGELLLMICISAPLGTAAAAASFVKAGVGGYTLAITLGLVVGVAGAWTMWTAGERLTRRVREHSEAVQEGYFRALYLSAMVWILVVACLGGWFSHILLRIVF